MPNHVTNELTAAKHVLDSIASDDSAIDFRKIVPRPVVFDCEPNSVVIDWARIAVGEVTLTTLREATPDPLTAFKAGDYGAASKRLEQSNILWLMAEGPFPKDFSPADFENFIACIKALKEFGYPSWYEWAIANWGTKWNAYTTKRVSDSVVTFKTAWSMPSKVITTLAEKFPQEQFRIRWADEDFGSNVGDLTFTKDRVIRGEKLEDDSIASHKLAMELLHGNQVPDCMIALADGRFGYRESA